MKTYEYSYVTRYEHMNYHESLYAGQAAAWLTECAFMAAQQCLGRPQNMVFKSILSCDFRHPTAVGEMIDYRLTPVRAGRSSLVFHVGVFGRFTGEQKIDAYCTVVTLNEAGVPCAHGLVLDKADDADELFRREQAEAFFR